MKDKKHCVFSARTTPEGLGILNGIRAELKIGWDELIVNAINVRYGVEIPMLPKDTGRKEEARAKIELARAEKEAEKAARKEALAQVKEAKVKVLAEKAEAKAEAKAKAEAEAKAKKELEE